MKMITETVAGTVMATGAMMATTEWDRTGRRAADRSVSARATCPLSPGPLTPRHVRGAGQPAPVHGVLALGRAALRPRSACPDRSGALAGLRRAARLPAGHDGADHVHPCAGRHHRRVGLRLPWRRELLRADLPPRAG